jgi:hypothetical protein
MIWLGPPPSARRRMRFSLRSLLLLTTVVAIAVYLIIELSRIETARQSFELSCAYFEVGRLATDDYLVELQKLHEAEVAIPWRLKSQARRNHVVRLEALHDRVYAKCSFDPEAQEQTLAKIQRQIAVASPQR